MYEVAALPVSATSTSGSDWTGGILYSILYPVMESSPGSSQVSVTESMVEVAVRFAGAAGGSTVGMLPRTVMGLPSDAAMWIADMSRTAPASMSSCEVAKVAANRIWAAVSVIVRVESSDVEFSAAPVRAVRLVSPAPPSMNMLSSLTLSGGVTSIVSLNVRVRTLVRTSKTASTSTGGVRSVLARPRVMICTAPLLTPPASMPP